MADMKLRLLGLPRGVPAIPVGACTSIGMGGMALTGNFAAQQESLGQCLKAQAMVHYGAAAYDGVPAGTVPVWGRDGKTIEFQPAGGSSAPGAVVWERKRFGPVAPAGGGNLLAGGGLAGLVDVPWTTTTTLAIIAAVGLVAFAGMRR